MRMGLFRCVNVPPLTQAPRLSLTSGCVSVLLFILIHAAFAAAQTIIPMEPSTFHFTENGYNVSILENSVGKTYVSPTVKMGIYLTDPSLDVKFKITGGDKKLMFKAEARKVGDFCFMLIRTTSGRSTDINRESTEGYMLSVKAKARYRPGPRLSTVTQVYVRVQDANDLSPLFYPVRYIQEVPENTALHASIVRVSASDADIGVNGEVYYSFDKRTDMFAIHPTSGVVTLTRLLRYDQDTLYEFKVFAWDRGPSMGGYKRKSRAELQIRVQEVNFYAPEIKLQELPAVVEHGKLGTVYAILYVEDRDMGTNGHIKSVDIIDGNQQNLFRLGPGRQQLEYTIQVAQILDREMDPYGFNLTIRAVDEGNPPRQTEKVIHVQLQDTNDQKPRFQKDYYNVSVDEWVPINTPLLVVNASDMDYAKNGEIRYKIHSGNIHDWFKINSRTGLISVAKPLDAENQTKVDMVIMAEDQGNMGSRRLSQTFVQITINDCNDNTPMFSPASAIVEVVEGMPIGTEFKFQPTAYDLDSGNNGYMSYSISNRGKVPFDIDSFTGKITTSEVLDYETMQREYHLRIRASDFGKEFRRESEMVLTVVIVDMNDNKPQFEKVNCVGYLSRDAPVGTQLLTISAIDFETTNIISYQIASGNNDNCFELMPSTGELKTKCAFESHHGDSIALTITATDGDNVAEPTMVNITLVNSRSRQIVNAHSNFNCQRTPVSGELAQQLKRAEENNQKAQNEVLETDPSAGQYLQNVHTPRFASGTPRSIKVSEGLQVGTSIVKLVAEDNDDNGYNSKLMYVISGGNDGDVFRVGTHDGVLSVMLPLDREVQDDYKLNVTVTDTGEPRRASYIMLTVQVQDVNDNAPVFERSSYAAVVREDFAINQTVLQVAATDADLNDNAKVVYSISSTGDFHIDRDTGVINTSAAMDREKKKEYKLWVKAVDMAATNPMSSLAMVTIGIEDINDNAPEFAFPTHVQQYHVRVREDLPIGTVILTITAYDPDDRENGRVRYALMDGMDDKFEVDRLTGIIRVVQELDYESKQVYNITARARDRGEPVLSTKCHVSIEVVDVNENLHAPEFKDFVFQGGVKENEPPNTVVLQLIATDRDERNPSASPQDYNIGYSIRNGTGLGRFTIDKNGYIRTTEVLDRESLTHFWLTVYAVDHGTVPRSSMVEVLVEVEDVNDNLPQTAQPVYYSAVMENSPEGTSVVRLEASDVDDTKNNQLTYRITSGNPQGFFYINRHSGLITTTNRKLNREKDEEHTLEVTITDNGIPSLSSTTRVVVTVADDNDESPWFTEIQYRIRIPQMAASEVDRPLYRVVAFDLDKGDNGKVDYSIMDAKDNGRFRIQPNTGMILSQKEFQAGEHYDMIVEAVDNGRPKRENSTRVMVEVVECPAESPNPPRFVEEAAEVHVMEKEVIGHLIKLMSADDLDGDKLWYSIKAGNSDDTFSIDPENGNIILARNLDWESVTAYNLSIQATDCVHRVTTSLVITVLDNNDNRPEFSQATYTVDVPENAGAGTEIFRVTATDRDHDHRLFYSIHSSSDQQSLSKFRINSETDKHGNWTGVITTRRALDREAMSHHVLTVMVRDQGLPTKRSYARVLLRVTDRNDHAPAFLEASYTGRVFETAAVGTSVLQVMATDQDHGRNAQLSYGIISGNLGSTFSIHSSLGIVTISRSLDNLLKSEYNLVVKATDGGTPALSATASISIQVTVSDNASPKFLVQEYTAELRENSPEKSHVITINALSRSSVVYDIIRGNVENMFMITPSSGVLANNYLIDYEANSFFNLTVRATNIVGKFVHCTILVHIVDENDNQPIFTQAHYTGNISEEASPGSVVLAADQTPLVIKAQDNDTDLNALLVYHIVEKEVQGVFDIDINTGALRTKVALNHERVAVYVFTVQVSDSGHPKQTAETAARVTIYVMDVNDSPPRFEQQAYTAQLLLSKFSAHEISAYRGIIVTTLTAQDDDLPENSPLQYSIISGNDPQHFLMDPSTGVITVGNVDNMRDTYELVIRVSDGKYLNQARLRIHVDLTQDSGLVFSEEEYYAEILENLTGVQKVVVVQAVGHEINEHLTFSILNPTEMFTMGQTSGVLSNTGLPFDRELQDNYTVTVEVRDHRVQPRIAHSVVRVHIRDVNDNAPVFVNQPYFAIVSVEAAPGDLVKRVTAVDRDIEENGHVTYSLLRGGDKKFAIDQSTGQISLNQALEKADQDHKFILEVEARDRGTPPLFTNTHVPLTIMNEATPVFSEPYYSVSVPESIPLHSAVLTIEANSPKGRKLIYSITSGDEYGEFSVHFETGSVTVEEVLDYELKHQYELTVRATDFQTGAFSETHVNIKLEDVNDNEPKFHSISYINTVSEAVPIGTSILSVAADDEDTKSNAKVHYSIQSDLRDIMGSNFFHIDSEKGIVLIKQKLDREVAATLRFYAVATDSGIPALSSSVPVMIIVSDLNDNPPAFDQPVYETTITDQVARGQFVTKVMASDADTSDAEFLAYSIVGGNSRQTFDIGEYTGILKVSSQRKPELQPQYNLNVSVTDGVFTNFARVVITVEYSNNHIPTFAKALYDVDIIENSPAGQYIAQVVAHDEDLGTYGELTYAIESEDAQELFRMDRENGKLYTRRPLDREEVALHSVPIVARDGGGRVGYTMVHVNVGDQADRRPQFQSGEFKANVYSNMEVGLQVIRVIAVDQDIGSNGDLQYSIYGGEETQATKYFHIDSKSGEITLREPLTGYENTLFQFFVRARDGGSPPQHSDVPLDVYVMGVEDHPPVFPTASSKYFVYEDKHVGSIIAAVMAEGNESLVYSIVSGDMDYTNNPAKFSIDKDGRISISEPLDRETTETFELTVKAETKTSPPLAAFCTVEIQIHDRNDNTPKFEANPYIVSIVENADVGASVLQVVAHDRDISANGELSYSLDPEDVHVAGVFEIDADQGWITTLVALNREDKDEYLFHVIAHDHGRDVKLTDVTTVKIAIMDHNDEPPVFTEAAYTGAVNEDALPGTVILVVASNDADLPPNNHVTYSITSNDPLGQFNIRNTGELYVNKKLDREEQASYKLTVAATDGAFVKETTVDVSILDANDNAPICAKPIYQSSVSETMALGFIARVNATDADEAGTRNARIYFSLSGDEDDIFHMQENTGIITIIKPLDRERTPEHHLVVTATDGGGLSCTTEVHITLKDENDNAPIFSQNTYTVQISEAAEINSLLTRLSATDADSGIYRKVRYALEPNEKIFKVDKISGIVSLAQPLDREKQHEYNVTVFAYDMGTHKMTTRGRLAVQVLDINDNPPVFERTTYDAVLQEDALPGAALIRVFATSLDTGLNAQISYSLVAGNELSHFQIDQTTGQVSVVTGLDYESVREYVLTVKALDGGSPPLSASAIIRANVTDANDNPPKFAQDVYKTSVREDVSTGTNVIQVLATDLDSMPNSVITYSLAAGDPSQQFHINPSDGYISVHDLLDRESIETYELEIHSKDSGSPQLTGTVTVHIDIMDINDSPPRFSTDNYTAVLQENKELGFQLIQLEVFDDDLDPNAGPFSFDIVDGNEGHEFHIDPTGVISTAARFNRQIKDSYLLSVRVYDNGEPPLYSDIEVEVLLIEESAFPPHITPLNVTVTAYDDEFPGGVIGRVKAIDPDPYDSLSFGIASDNTHLFDINVLDGTLKAVQSLDAGEYFINISVTDNKFLTYMESRLTVVGISPDMAESGVVLRLKHVMPEEFVTTFRMPLISFVKAEMGVDSKDVIILSIQSASNTVVTPLTSSRRKRRDTDSDLDVLLVVRRKKDRFFRSNNIRKQLTKVKAEMELTLNLQIDRITSDVCQRDSCKYGRCITVVHFNNNQVFTILTETESYVSATHNMGYKCDCHPGYAGPLCQDKVDLCTPNPCASPKFCLLQDDDLSYECACPEGTTGDNCELEDSTVCEDISCRATKPMTFSGQSYISWRLTVPMERRLSLSLDLKTAQENSRLMHAVGSVDYSILEIEDGMIQYRFDCGSGEGMARVDKVHINDGYWHSIAVERTSQTVKIIIDGKFSAEGSAPGTNDVLNLDSNNMYFGAEVQLVANAQYEDVRKGFVGCMQHIQIEGTQLPLSGSSNVGVLQNLRDIMFHCEGTYIPGVCSSSPCQNGGLCYPLSKDSFMCQCRSRFMGARCEVDTNPCASSPCLHGGLCENLSNDYQCVCTGKLTGKRCEKNFYCAPNPCKNSASCRDGLNGPICDCNNGFRGELCQHDINECQNSPCMNGGECTNLHGSFNCTCVVEGAGQLCEDTIFPNITSSPLNFDWKSILVIVGVLVVVIIIVVIFAICMRQRRRKRQLRATADNDFIYNCEDLKANKKSNVENMQNNMLQNMHSNSPRGNMRKSPKHPSKHASPRPPPVPTRPASYTPSTADSLNTLNNCNFDHARNYGSAADELENIESIREPIEIPEFMRNVDAEKSPRTMNRSLPPPPHDEEPSLKPRLDPRNLNIAENYPSDLKKQVKYIPSEQESVASLQLLHADHCNSISSLPISESEDDMANALLGKHPGYHWDISDWHPDSTPLPRISELPSREVHDSHSSSPHSNEENNVPIDPNGYEDTDYPDEFLDHDSEYVGDSEYPETEGEIDDDCDDANIDFHEQPDFHKILAMQQQLRFDSEPDLRPATDYHTHPDQYLPHYNISQSNSQVDLEEEETPYNEEEGEDEDDDYNGNYSADNIARDDDTDVIYYGFPRSTQKQFVPQDITGNEYNTLEFNRRSSLMDDMSMSVVDTASNVSESDIAGLCEIEDSEANLSDCDIEIHEMTPMLSHNIGQPTHKNRDPREGNAHTQV